MTFESGVRMSFCSHNRNWAPLKQQGWIYTFLLKCIALKENYGAMCYFYSSLMGYGNTYTMSSLDPKLSIQGAHVYLMLSVLQQGQILSIRHDTPHWLINSWLCLSSYVHPLHCLSLQSALEDKRREGEPLHGAIMHYFCKAFCCLSAQDGIQYKYHSLIVC